MKKRNPAFANSSSDPVDLHLFWTGGAAGSSAVTPAKLATYDAAAVELATRAAMLSTSISGFTFLDSPSNLSALKHLFVNTGGSLLAYSPESLNQLPQDVYEKKNISVVLICAHTTAIDTFPRRGGTSACCDCARPLASAWQEPTAPCTQTRSTRASSA